MSDPIERQDAIDVVKRLMGDYELSRTVQTGLYILPSAQPEPAIPISWLEKEIEHLESYENSFAVLDAMQLKALIKRWESEQNDTDDTE